MFSGSHYQASRRDPDDDAHDDEERDLDEAPDRADNADDVIVPLHGGSSSDTGSYKEIGHGYHNTRKVVNPENTP